MMRNKINIYSFYALIVSKILDSVSTIIGLSMGFYETNMMLNNMFNVYGVIPSLTVTSIVFIIGYYFICMVVDNIKNITILTVLNAIQVITVFSTFEVVVSNFMLILGVN